MRVERGLPDPWRPAREQMWLINAVPLIGNRRIRCSHRKCMCQRARMQIGPQRLIEGLQALIIKIIGVIPEQAQVKLRVPGNGKQAGKFLDQLFLLRSPRPSSVKDSVYMPAKCSLQRICEKK